MFCLQPKGGLDFAAELAAKIGVVPVKNQDSDDNDDDEKVADGEWSDEGHQGPPQTPEVQEKQLHSSTTKSRSETSKSKEKKSHHHSHHHHHHEKKERSESHGEHKHRKRRGSKTSHSSHTSVDTRQSVPAEDGEKKKTAFLCTFLMFKFFLRFAHCVSTRRCTLKMV